MSSKNFAYTGGVVNSVSNYRKSYYARKYENGIPPDSDPVAINRMLVEYHAEGTTEERKLELKHDILMRAFFLFPHYLKRNYFLTAELFSEAVQYMTCNTLQAIELFKPELGYPFSNYLIGYFRDAATKTLKSCNIVSSATLRQASIDASLPPEDCEMGESPYLVSTEGESPMATEDRFDDEPVTLDEPIRKKQRVIRGATRVLGNAVELDDSREYALAPGMEKELDVDDRIHQAQLIEWLEEALSAESGLLTEDERFVLIHHYGLFGHKQMKYEEIAEIRRQFGRGSACSRISQINTAAVKKVRQYFLENGVIE